MTNDEERFKEINGLTIEERLKVARGMTSEEWHAKLEELCKAKTGMTPDEWLIKRFTSLTPIDFLKKQNGVNSDNDATLVKDLQVLGLNDSVINVLFEYVVIISRIGLVHPLVREMGESWFERNILTIEKAIVFVREELKKEYPEDNGCFTSRRCEAFLFTN